MTQVAVIAYPGQKIESSLIRAIQFAGLKTRVFREGDDLTQLARSKSFVISGTVNENLDYSSASIMAYHPLSQVILKESKKNKPILGIGFGAMLLTELGLVPACKDLKNCLSITYNKDHQDEHLNDPEAAHVFQSMKRVVPKDRTPFTYLVSSRPFLLPLNGPKSRFVTYNETLNQELLNKKQIIFQYDEEDLSGSIHKAAAISNNTGNILAIMANFTRVNASDRPKIFESLQYYLEKQPKLNDYPNLELDLVEKNLTVFTPQGEEMIYEENSPSIQRLEKFLQKHLGEKITLHKYLHFDLLKANLEEIRSSEALISPNTVREIANLSIEDSSLALLVREKEDIKGQLLTEELSMDHHIALASLDSGVLWVIKGLSPLNRDRILNENLLFNQIHQDVFLYKD